MRVEITVAKTQPLPPGALDALASELGKRILHSFPDSEPHVSVRYASANNLTVMGRGGKEARERITEILQETWESADEWFQQ